MVVLETERLRLRPFARDDVDALHVQWTEPAVLRYLWDGRVMERDDVAAIVEESIASFAARKIGFWTIEERAAASLVGFAGLRAMAGTTDVELYYGLASTWWHRGLATEASHAVLRYGFSTGFERIYIRTDGPNSRSVEVMKRLGAEYVRTDATGEFGSTIVYVVRS